MPKDGHKNSVFSRDFDPDGPGAGGLFGLPFDMKSAAVVVLPVPFEATTSFGHGTAGAPEAILEASHQVDLCDPETGDPWQLGLAFDDVPPWLPPLAEEARGTAAAVRAGKSSPVEVDQACRRVADHVRNWTESQLRASRIPAILGGDHSVPLGAFEAAAAVQPGLGLLQIDAHADLRDSYEGFRYSHASIMNNALQIEGVDSLVQVGVRDFGTREWETIEQDGRIECWTDRRLAAAQARGQTLGAVADDIVACLPERVWISFDVDGLDPSLCPHTGTPVPGGLSWREALCLLATLGASGRRIVGFDLCEVGDRPWDANVGARLLYKLAGWALVTRQH